MHVPVEEHAELAEKVHEVEVPLDTEPEVQSTVEQALSLHTCSFTLSPSGSLGVPVAVTVVPDELQEGDRETDVGVFGGLLVVP